MQYLESRAATGCDCIRRIQPAISATPKLVPLKPGGYFMYQCARRISPHCTSMCLTCDVLDIVSWYSFSHISAAQGELFPHLNLLKPTGHVMHHQFNIQQLYALPTRCIYVFCIYLRTNSDLCHLQHKLIGFYNWGEKCLQRGTDWVFK